MTKPDGTTISSVRPRGAAIEGQGPRHRSRGRDRGVGNKGHGYMDGGTGFQVQRSRGRGPEVYGEAEIQPGPMTQGQGGLAHLPIGNARRLCTTVAFPILCLTKGDHCSQRQLPLYLSPSHPAPSPLAVLPLYLPLCAPSQPIETIKTPCMGEGV